MRGLHPGEHVLDVEHQFRPEQVCRAPDNPKEQKPCDGKGSPVRQFEPSSEGACEECQQNRKKERAESHDENREEQVNKCECRKCDEKLADS